MHAVVEQMTERVGLASLAAAEAAVAATAESMGRANLGSSGSPQSVLWPISVVSECPLVPVPWLNVKTIDISDVSLRCDHLVSLAVESDHEQLVS